MAALLLAALFWSSAGIALKSISMTNGIVISGYRSIFAALFYLIVFKKPRIEKSKWFVTGMTAYALTTTLFSISNTMTTAANAIVLQYTAPIFVCLYAWIIFKKPLPVYDIIATVIIFLGILLFFVDSLALQTSSKMFWGNILSIMSGVTFGLQASVLGQAKTPHNAIVFGNLFNIVFAAPFILRSPFPNMPDLLLLFFLGVVQLGAAYFLYVYAIPKVSPLELILIPALEPILNPVWVFLVVGERPSLFALLGGGIVIGTIVIWSVYKERIKKRIL